VAPATTPIPLPSFEDCGDSDGELLPGQIVNSNNSDNDSEVVICVRNKRKRNRLIDDEAELSGSDIESDNEQDLSSAGSIIDYASDISEGVDHLAVLNSTEVTVSNNLLKMASSDLDLLGSEEISDVELNRIMAVCRGLDDNTRLQLLFFCGVKFYDVFRQLKQCEYRDDPVMCGLYARKEVSRNIDGFVAYLEDMCKLKFDLGRVQLFKRCDEAIAIANSKLGTSSLVTLKTLATDISSYCLDDILNGENLCMDDFRDSTDMFSKIVGLFTLDIINDFISFYVPEHAHELTLRRVKINGAPETAKTPVKTAESFLEDMELTPDKVRSPFRKRMRPLHGLKVDPIIPVWVGEEVEAKEQFANWKNTPSLKNIVASLRSKALKSEATGIVDCAMVMSLFKDYSLQIHKVSHCPLSVARMMAVDITNCHLQSYSATPPQNLVELSQSQSFSGMYECDVPKDEESDIAHYPQKEDIADVLHSNEGINDQRFRLLPLGWKCRDGCPLGIFQEYPQLTTNHKNILVVVFGTEQIVKFTENVSEFMKFNSTTTRMAKTGIFGVENRTRCKLGDEPIMQILYVVLTMARAQQLKDAVTEILWFLKKQGIPNKRILFEVFNYQDHFADCYKDVEEFRKASLDGGFVGPPNTVLRKKLQINDKADEETNRAFQIIYEEFHERNIKTTPDAISLINKTVNEVCQTSEFAKALRTVMGSATGTQAVVKIALWWNDQLLKYRPECLGSNKGWIAYQLALQLFTECQKMCGGFMLDKGVEIEDWDETQYGPIDMRGTLCQKHIWSTVEKYRTRPSNLIRILKENGISLAHFFNTYVQRLVIGERRQKTVVMSGPKMSGKTITAEAIRQLHGGVRLGLDSQGGRDFKIDEATNYKGLVVIEDLQQTSMASADKTLRPYLDGDVVTTNKKMEKVGSGRWAPTIITTNVAIDSDSDDEDAKREYSLRANDIFTYRYAGIKFRTHLPTVLKNSVISHIATDEILDLIWRYGLFPQCNTLFANAPRCAYMPCSGLAFGDHHPGCRMLADIASNLEFGVRFQYHAVDNVLHEIYDRAMNEYVGLLFDIDHVLDISKALEWHFQCSTLEIANCRNEERKQRLIKTTAEISQFITKVWTPLTYLSRYLRGDFSRKQACKWSHQYVVKNPLFYAWDEMQTPLANFPLVVEKEDWLDYLVLPWCSDRRFVGQLRDVLLECTNISDDEAILEKWASVINGCKSRMIAHLKHYIHMTSRQKRWKKRAHARAIQSRLLDKSSDELLLRFDALFVRLIKPPKLTLSGEKAIVVDRPIHFYD
jgi:hypothetical protein